MWRFFSSNRNYKALKKYTLIVSKVKFVNDEFIEHILNLYNFPFQIFSYISPIFKGSNYAIRFLKQDCQIWAVPQIDWEVLSNCLIFAIDALYDGFGENASLKLKSMQPQWSSFMTFYPLCCVCFLDLLVLIPQACLTCLRLFETLHCW